MDTVKIKPSHPSQGEFVVINADEFDPVKHQKLDEKQPEKPKRTKAE